tara:strand:+ start:2029 stop:2670 length:642 start_codon:yes stop_codon:yes gene_type:complete
MQHFEGIYFRSRIIHGDLITANAKLTGQLDPSGTWIPFLKTALMSLGDLADLETQLRKLYLDHPDLGEAMKSLEVNLRFAKYLRNVFAGHLNDELIAKTYEWRPELRKLPEIREANGTIALNFFVLETAINTYVAADGSHGKFPSETDLYYPPDMDRFCAWLSDTVRLAINACDLLGSITHGDVAPLGEPADEFESFITAGLTEFSRIRKGRS